ncbi:hypothetical protein DFH29DRAFT_179286 [Suillus ampliporus]|nr:hypothetical protein DFH29DRAFT_179286 [Suillus ampliporus]
MRYCKDPSVRSMGCKEYLPQPRNHSRHGDSCSHLPVRTLLFQCSVCMHGGHQECYRRYYMERPMVDIPASSSARGRSLIRERDDDMEEGEEVTSCEGRLERTLAGHPCAAGCGHYCWAAVGGHLGAEEAS